MDGVGAGVRSWRTPRLSGVICPLHISARQASAGALAIADGQLATTAGPANSFTSPSALAQVSHVFSARTFGWNPFSISRSLQPVPFQHPYQIAQRFVDSWRRPVRL